MTGERRGKKKRRAGEPGPLEGRTHADYLALRDEERARTVQTGCVEGAAGDARAILMPVFRQEI